jgi:hypothetical protein
MRPTILRRDRKKGRSLRACLPTAQSLPVHIERKIGTSRFQDSLIHPLPRGPRCQPPNGWSAASSRRRPRHRAAPGCGRAATRRPRSSARHMDTKRPARLRWRRSPRAGDASNRIEQPDARSALNCPIPCDRVPPRFARRPLLQFQRLKAVPRRRRCSEGRSGFYANSAFGSNFAGAMLWSPHRAEPPQHKSTQRQGSFCAQKQESRPPYARLGNSMTLK